MFEFEKHLHFYSNHWWPSFSGFIPENQLGNVEIAKSYLDKYWLPSKEFEIQWKSILNNIFINQEKGLPDWVFKEEFKVLALRGGCLFVEDSFKRLQQCLSEIGEKYFVIVENKFGQNEDEPAFRLKFPTNISWDELMSGDYISSIVFEMYFHEYFVFGESGDWGKYSANDYENPLDLIGFKQELAHIFRKQFEQNKNEKEEIFQWLPNEYKIQNNLIT